MFLPRDASAVLAIGLCPCLSVPVSVCLSQVGVLLKRLNVGSHKQLEESTLLRVQIPEKAKFALNCVRNSMLSCYLFIIAKLFMVKDGCLKFVYIGKNPWFMAFLDSKIHTRLAIVTANELGLAFPHRNFPKKFRPDPSTFYVVIVAIDKQTNRQINRQTNVRR